MKLHRPLIYSLFFSFLVGCSDFEEKSSKANSQQVDNQTGVSVVDDTGATISLERPAQRIIALAPHVVENVYSAGAGEMLVAIVDHSNYPTIASELPSVGGYNKFNIEAIAALNPDVIFAWQSGTPAHFFDKIKQLGIPLYLDEPSTIEAVANSIRNIGILTGNEKYAEEIALKHTLKLKELQSRQKDKQIVNVFYQVWDDPIYTINGKQIISDVLRLCGGNNIYADETIKAPIISLESLIERNPDVIMTGSLHKSADDALGHWKKWPSMNAVKHKNLFVVNPDIVTRHTARILQGAESVCEKLDIARENLRQFNQ
jgi:iron complex transport system substrate-binding protein